jgi:hypothetical protein
MRRVRTLVLRTAPTFTPPPMPLPILKQCPDPQAGLADHAAERPCTRCGHALIDVREMSDEAATVALAGADRTPCAVYSHRQARRLGLLPRPPIGWLAAAAAMVAALLPGRAVAQQPENPVEAPHADADSTCILRGVVRDAAGNPVAAAVIRAAHGRGQTLTGADGSFQLRLRDAGEVVQVEVLRLGYQSRTLQLETNAGTHAIQIGPASTVTIGIVIGPLGPPEQSRLQIERVLRAASRWGVRDARSGLR